MDASSCEGILRPVLADMNMADVSMTDASEATFKGIQSNNNSENPSFGTSCKENLKPEGLALPIVNQSYLNVSVGDYASDDDTCVSYHNKVLNLTSLAEQFNNLQLETPGPRKTAGYPQSPDSSFRAFHRSGSSSSLYKSILSENESVIDPNLSPTDLENGLSVLSSPLKVSHNASDINDESQSSESEKLNSTIEPETPAALVEGKSPLKGNQLAESTAKEADSKVERSENKTSLNGFCEEQPESISSVDSISENCAVDDSFKTASNPDLASTENEESTSVNNFYSAKSSTDVENQNADETIVVENCTAEVSECSENLETSASVQKDLNCSGTSRSQSPPEEQISQPEEHLVASNQAIKSEDQPIRSEDSILKSEASEKSQEYHIPDAEPLVEKSKEESDKPEPQAEHPIKQVLQSEELIIRSESAGKPVEPTDTQLEQAFDSKEIVNQSEEKTDKLEEQIIRSEPTESSEERTSKQLDQASDSEELAGKSIEEADKSEEQAEVPEEDVETPKVFETKRLSLGVSSYFKVNNVDSDNSPSRESCSSSEDGFSCSRLTTIRKSANQFPAENLSPSALALTAEEKPNSSPPKTSGALDVESVAKESVNLSKISLSTCDLENEALDISAANSVSSKIASPRADGSNFPGENQNASYTINPNENFGESWNSEAGPVTAAEEIFEDPSAFDFLVQRGNNAVNSNLYKKSLFVKFDPFVPINSPSQIEKQISASLKMADENSGDEKCDVQSKKNPVTPLKNPALEAVGKLIEASPNVPGVDSKGLEAELANLQELLIQQEKEFKEKLQKAERNESKLRKDLSEKTKNKDRYSTIMDEYEKTITQMVAQKEVWESKLKAVESERDTTMQHLNNLEIAFNDVHQKYERSKAVIESLKQNEDILKASVQEYDVAIKKQENKYEMLKQHAKSQLEKANQELEVRTKSQDAESAKLRALLKKSELKTSSLEQALEQKTKENQELMKICDELINKVGGSS